MDEKEHDALEHTGLIKSIGYDQAEIIQAILYLYVPNRKIDCDPMYSKGGFYKGTGIEVPRLRYDINPVVDGVVEADARNLPIEAESISSMILDPPFLATTGKSLQENGSGNKINRRFGVFPNEKSLCECYVDLLNEAYRVLKPEGILIFKCQDKVSSGKQYMMHVFVMNEAVKRGFYPKDLFVLLAKNRLVADWQAKNQKHARKYHSYFWVFEKDGPVIEYG